MYEGEEVALLGRGVNTLTGEFARQAIEIPEDSAPDRGKAAKVEKSNPGSIKIIVVPNRRIDSNTKVCLSFSELKSALETSLGITAPQIGIQLDSFRIEEHSENDLYFLVSLSYLEEIHTIGGDCTLTSVANNLLDLEHGVPNLRAFIHQYGNAFVREIKLGREAYIIIRFQAISATEKILLSANLSSLVGPAEVAGKIRKAVSQVNANATYKIHLMTRGLSYASSGVLPTLKDLDKFIRNALTTDKDNKKIPPVQIGWVSQFYSRTITFPKPKAAQQKGAFKSLKILQEFEEICKIAELLKKLILSTQASIKETLNTVVALNSNLRESERLYIDDARALNIDQMKIVNQILDKLFFELKTSVMFSWEKEGNKGNAQELKGQLKEMRDNLEYIENKLEACAHFVQRVTSYFPSEGQIMVAYFSDTTIRSVQHRNGEYTFNLGAPYEATEYRFDIRSLEERISLILGAVLRTIDDIMELELSALNEVKDFFKVSRAEREKACVMATIRLAGVQASLNWIQDVAEVASRIHFILDPDLKDTVKFCRNEINLIYELRLFSKKLGESTENFLNALVTFKDSERKEKQSPEGLRVPNIGKTRGEIKEVFDKLTARVADLLSERRNCSGGLPSQKSSSEGELGKLLKERLDALKGEILSEETPQNKISSAPSQANSPGTPTVRPSITPDASATGSSMPQEGSHPITPDSSATGSMPQGGSLREEDDLSKGLTLVEKLKNELKIEKEKKPQNKDHLDDLRRVEEEASYLKQCFLLLNEAVKTGGDLYRYWKEIQDALRTILEKKKQKCKSLTLSLKMYIGRKSQNSRPVDLNWNSGVRHPFIGTITGPFIRLFRRIFRLRRFILVSDSLSDGTRLPVALRYENLYFKPNFKEGSVPPYNIHVLANCNFRIAPSKQPPNDEIRQALSLLLRWKQGSQQSSSHQDTSETQAITSGLEPQQPPPRIDYV